MACALYRHARGSYPEDVGPGKVVVLTPYRSQVGMMLQTARVYYILM